MLRNYKSNLKIYYKVTRKVFTNYDQYNTLILILGILDVPILPIFFKHSKSLYFYKIKKLIVYFFMR